MSRHAHIVAFAAAVCAAACSQPSDADNREAQAGGEGAPVPVEYAVLVEGPIEDTLHFSSTLRAEIQVQVVSRTTGQVRVRKVEEGDAVAANDVLLRLEADEQSAALMRITNDLELAQRNTDRHKQLHTQGVVADEALENAQFELERLKLARKDAARGLKYTTVVAPVKGIITQRFVKFGDMVGPNQPLFEIADFDSLVAEVFVPQKDIRKISVGSVARLSSTSGGAPIAEGTVERIAPVVDPRSGTIKVTIDLPDTSELRPGMFATVNLVVASEKRALLLPRRALVYDDDQPYAFKIEENGTAVRIKVEMEIEDTTSIVPARGFSPGDKVVVAGQVGLKSGTKVEAQEVGATAGETTASEGVKRAPPAGESEDDTATKKPAETAKSQP